MLKILHEIIKPYQIAKIIHVSDARKILGVDSLRRDQIQIESPWVIAPCKWYPQLKQNIQFPYPDTVNSALEAEQWAFMAERHSLLLRTRKLYSPGGKTALISILTGLVVSITLLFYSSLEGSPEYDNLEFPIRDGQVIRLKPYFPSGDGALYQSNLLLLIMLAIVIIGLLIMFLLHREAGAERWQNLSQRYNLRVLAISTRPSVNIKSGESEIINMGDGRQVGRSR